ncbi:MAG: hypothetical protein OXI94_07250 [Gemmatimonadota bacterium]|nr:hypothetical protein [Gemmatimonadota bacterium]MDE2952941.1 hypothetical protein [Gemmatimonadota bacterium]
MDHEILVNQLRLLLEKLSDKWGPVALFMLNTFGPGFAQPWHLIVSAKELDYLSRSEAIKEMTTLVREHGDESFWRPLIRITVLKTQDPFVRSVNASMQVSPNEIETISDTTVAGFEIPYALLIRPQRIAAV